MTKVIIVANLFLGQFLTMNNKDEIGQKVARARVARGWTRYRLSKNIQGQGKDVKLYAVDAVEQGKNYTIDTLLSVLDALELNLKID